jgi:hypothetical protein
MKTLVLTLLLTGTSFTAAADMTVNDLALLRIILRQDMARDVAAASASSDSLGKERIAPLMLVSNDPNKGDWDTLVAIVADPNVDEYQRLNAARVLAYFGDRRSVDLLSKTVQGRFATAGDEEKGKAALCLVYLQCDLPEGFAFSRLARPLYPELDVFIKKTSPPIDPNGSYTSEDIQRIVGAYMGLRVEVRGPLSVAEVETERLIELLSDVAQYPGMRGTPRLPFVFMSDKWQAFTRQIRDGDLIYFFTSDTASWHGLFGREGYALIRDGKVICTIITGMS